MLRILAFKGKQGGNQVYTLQLSFKQAVALIDRELYEDADSVTQRDMDVRRVVNEIIPYLRIPDHFLPPLIVEVRGELSEEPISGFGDAVMLGLSAGTQLLIRDGQHRLEAIRQAIDLMPELAEEHIAVIVLPFDGYQRSQTLFADINRNAKPVGRSLGTFMDNRAVTARIAKVIAKECPFLKGRISYNLSLLRPSSGALYTLYSLEIVSRELLETLGACPETHLAFWNHVLENVAPVRRLHEGTMKLSELRRSTICGTAIFLYSIADAAKALHKQGLPPTAVADAVARIDWYKNSTDLDPLRLPDGSLALVGAIATNKLARVLVTRAGGTFNLSQGNSE